MMILIYFFLGVICSFLTYILICFEYKYSVKPHTSKTFDAWFEDNELRVVIGFTLLAWPVSLLIALALLCFLTIGFIAEQIKKIILKKL